jgi:hypothetical protein
MSDMTPESCFLRCSPSAPSQQTCFMDADLPRCRPTRILSELRSVVGVAWGRTVAGWTVGIFDELSPDTGHMGFPDNLNSGGAILSHFLSLISCWGLWLIGSGLPDGIASQIRSWSPRIRSRCRSRQHQSGLRPSNGLTGNNVGLSSPGQWFAHYLVVCGPYLGSECDLQDRGLIWPAQGVQRQDWPHFELCRRLLACPHPLSD